MVLLSKDATGVHVEIRDTGPGIPIELQPVIFTRPAYTASGASRGGLGLLIVYKILALHDSTIQLEHHKGYGAVFSFHLQ